MEKKNYIVAIDIGSSEVVIAVGLINENGSLEVQAIASVATEGVSAGLVDNNDFVVQALRKARAKAFLRATMSTISVVRPNCARGPNCVKNTVIGIARTNMR